MSAGAREVLADYELPDGTVRALVAQRINGRVAVADVPIRGDGRVYLVERHIESLAALDGLVNAYVARSKHCGCPAVIAQRHVLEGVVRAA